MGIFLERFFHLSQFKRSAIPNAPKVGSGGSLSPRSDWRAPSDAQAAVWLDEAQPQHAGCLTIRTGLGTRIQVAQQVPNEPPLRLLLTEYKLMEREWCEIQRLMRSR